MAEQTDTYLSLDLALRIGEILLSSGSGAADVTATMLTVTGATGLRNVSADVTFTQLTLTHQPRVDEPAVVQQRRVTMRGIDYADLTEVDHLVRRLAAHEVTVDEARSALAQVVSTGHRRPRWAVAIGWGAMGAGIALLLGGGFVVSAIAFVAAVLIDNIKRVMSRGRWPDFYQQVAGAFVATLLALATEASGLDVEPSRVVTVGIVMLLAGIGFVGAAQDALAGFPVTAGARILEAVLATAGIVAGVSGGLALGRVLGINIGRFEPGAVALAAASVMVLGAAITAAAFAFASYAPLRSLAPIAVVGGLGQVVVLSLDDPSLGSTWATAAAAIVVGVVSYSVAGRVRVPPLVVVVSSVVPLLPGLAIYRGLTLLSEGGDGMNFLASAGATAIALAAGVLLGQYIAQPLRKEARRLENRLAGPRLVGPLRGRRKRG